MGVDLKRLAIDFGRVRLGVAASDETGSLAFARTTLNRKGNRADIARLVRLITEEEALEIVVGLPLRADGSETPTSAAARRFGDLLGEASGKPVVLVDERFSSLEATDRLREAGVSGRDMRDRKDSEAARIILQRYLDQLASEEA